MFQPPGLACRGETRRKQGSIGSIQNYKGGKQREGGEEGEEKDSNGEKRKI